MMSRPVAPGVEPIPSLSPKYLILTADFPPIEGGISTLTTQLAEGLAQRDRLGAVGAPRMRSQSTEDCEFAYPVFYIPGYSWGPLRILPARAPVLKWVKEHGDGLSKIIAMRF